MTSPPARPPAPAIDGAARLFAILGDPIAQARSVGAWNGFFARAGRNAVMLPFHVAAGDLAATVAGMRRLRNLDGFVLTMPHKQAVMPLLDAVLPGARLVGAVNTVRRRADGGFEGDMFDGRGFVAGVRAAGHRVSGARAALLGAGGAGRAIAFALADLGLAALRVDDADPARAASLAADLRAAFPALAAAAGPLDPRGVDLAVNATPVGMKPGDAPPFAAERLAPPTVVCDAVPNPEITALLAAARARGCAIVTGRAMFEGQAAEAARFLGFAEWPG